MKTNAALKLIPPRRVNLHQPEPRHNQPRGYYWPISPKPSRLQVFLEDFVYPGIGILGFFAIVLGAPALVLAAITGKLDAILAPVFKALGL